jgi:hypothetical protein
MQKFDILLKKRGFKSVLYIVASVFILFILALTFKSTITKFVWYHALFYIILLTAGFITLKGLFQFFLYKEVRLVAESDGEKLKFYCLNDKGKQFNVSDEFKLDDISRIYIVQKSTRYMYRNYYYEIEGKSKLSTFLKEKIEVFPSLFEAGDEDRKAILGFVSSLNPGISTGYENLIQKMMK